MREASFDLKNNIFEWFSINLKNSNLFKDFSFILSLLIELHSFLGIILKIKAFRQRKELLVNEITYFSERKKTKQKKQCRFSKLNTKWVRINLRIKYNNNNKALWMIFLCIYHHRWLHLCRVVNYADTRYFLNCKCLVDWYQKYKLNSHFFCCLSFWNSAN